MTQVLKQIISVSFLLLFFSCSEYNEIVKSDDYELKLSKAETLYEAGSYNRALPLYEQVYQRSPRDGRGELAYYRLAKSYYAIEDYYMAGYYFSNFVNRFPSSTKGEECLFMGAICSVKLSPEASLDQEETELALNDLQLFVQRYPNSNLVDSCNLVMDQLREKLEYKAFLSVKLYAQTERFKAAVVSGKSFIESYPQSQYREEVSFIMLENASILAEKSVFSKQKERLEDVLEIYSSYQVSFDKRRYQTRAKQYQERALRLLEKVNEETDFRAILASFSSSQSLSAKKKMDYLNETIERYHKFAKKYPDSEFLKKATETKDKADKEIRSIQ